MSGSRRAEAPDAWPVTLVDGTRFEAPAGVDLITSARAAGWRLASSCRNGTCRTCRCVLVAGRIEHRIEWPGLSRDELAEGWILPCVALPRSPLVLQTGAEPLTAGAPPAPDGGGSGAYPAKSWGQSPGGGPVGSR